MIKLKAVSKGYMTKHHGWKQVLDNVTAEIPQNKSIGILGRNGAGKSTLMRLICGLDVPDKGRIDTGNARLSWPLGGQVGMHGSLTGRENIQFVCRIYNRKFQPVFDYVQDFAELGDYMDIAVKTYSSGMKSRLAFGISMALDFDTYLIDEGFSAGDARFRAKTEIIFTEKRKKANIIIVSHNPKTITQFCDSAAILDNGRLILINDLEEAIRIYSAL